MLRLKELRKEKGVLQKEVAAYLGVDRTTYVRYENGQSNPDYDTLIKLSKYFNVSTDYILGVVTEKKNIAKDDDIFSSQDLFNACVQSMNNFYPHTDLKDILWFSYSSLDEDDKEKVLSFVLDLQGNRKYKKLFAEHSTEAQMRRYFYIKLCDDLQKLK